MELFVFLGGAFVLTAIWMRRVRVGGSYGRSDMGNAGLPDDQRDKNVGMLGLPNRGRPTGGN
jgi:hypothetical protein